MVAVDPSATYLPTGAKLQSACAEAACPTYLPTKHASHATLAEAPMVRPGKQAWHAGWPVEFCAKPAGHCAHGSSAGMDVAR